MLAEFAIRFALGGAIVCAFAVVGEGFKPKTFAGIFGAAPSVALASLALAYAKHGRGYVQTEARSMLIGAAAFYAYGAACVLFARRERLPLWLSASVAWVAWFAVAFAIWGAGKETGILQ